MKEEQIRPAQILDEYLRLSAKDAHDYFKDGIRTGIPCVACGSTENQVFQFHKHGFDYQLCSTCHSLYLSPRPDKAAFDQFYVDSPSSNYWANVFFPTVAEPRRDLLFAPKAKQILELCEQRNVTLDTYIDVGAGYGILLEEFRKLSPKTKIMAVEPGAELAKTCREKGLEVLEATAEDAHEWNDKADLVTCFEVLEHAHCPLTFLESLKNLAKDGGQVLITTLTCDGFDIQCLWENSKSVSPPHHINFLSVAGLKELMERAGLSDVYIHTPGKLDVNIVENYCKQNPEHLGKLPNFAQTLLKRDEQTKENFQQFLKDNQMSSHVWAIGTKK
jgi:SAM-dependent methyltransferase